MVIGFEVELDYGEDGPTEGEPSPTSDDVAHWIRVGMAAEAFASVDVFAKRQ